MQETESKSSQNVGSTTSGKIPSTVSSAKSDKQEPERVTLGPLSKDLSIYLLSLSKKVTENEVTPQTVSAACQCAAELYKIMKLNWEMKR